MASPGSSHSCPAAAPVERDWAMPEASECLSLRPAATGGDDRVVIGRVMSLVLPTPSDRYLQFRLQDPGATGAHTALLFFAPAHHAPFSGRPSFLGRLFLFFQFRLPPDGVMRRHMTSHGVIRLKSLEPSCSAGGAGLGDAPASECLSLRPAATGGDDSGRHRKRECHSSSYPPAARPGCSTLGGTGAPAALCASVLLPGSFLSARRAGFRFSSFARFRRFGSWQRQ